VRLVAVAALAAVAAAGADSARSADVYVAFRTPSGNIGCGFDHFSGEAPHLRCDIRSRLHDPPPVRPRGCDLDYGDSLAMGRRGRPYLVCHGDTAIDPRAPKVPYGSTWSREGFRCRSRASGLTCTNPAGHGFFLSRERWRIF
jgi:hypothetical protein